MPFTVDGILNASQIQLEKAAVDKFGSAVEDFSRNNLGPLAAFLPTSGKPQAPIQSKPNTWVSSSYAAALAGPTDFRPKLKFLFKVEFIFTKEAKNAYPSIFDGRASNDFTFMIKSVDRPKIEFEYEDDVNMYNFRTKVLKKIRHRELSMVFMDDTGNRIFNFFRAMMMIYSPITRNQLGRDFTLRPPDAKIPENGSGMTFSAQGGISPADTSHRSVVNSTFGNAIEAIRVKQIFVDPSKGIEDATQMVSFDFLNPRIMAFDLDELSHELSEASNLTMTFDYDWMEMVNIGPLRAVNEDDQKFNIRPPGFSPIPGDITHGRPGGPSGRPDDGIVDSSASSAGKGNNNIFAGIIAGAASRATTELTADAINRAVATTAGNGRFATAIGGTVSGLFTGPISGLTSNIVREKTTGIFSSIFNPNARPASSTVEDASTAGADKSTLTTSSGAYTVSNPANEG